MREDTKKPRTLGCGGALCPPAFLRVRKAFPLFSPLLLPVWHPLVQKARLGSVHKLFPALEFQTGSLGKDIIGCWRQTRPDVACLLQQALLMGTIKPGPTELSVPWRSWARHFPDLGHWEEEEEEHDQGRPPSRIFHVRVLYVTETLEGLTRGLLDDALPQKSQKVWVCGAPWPSMECGSARH